MLMFTLAISCLITSNLPWFMDLMFQVLMQYCSLQHRILLLSPVPSTTGCCFCFGLVSSFFLELFLHWYPVACWVPTDLGSSSFSILLFCLFILFMGFSRQEYWSALPFLSPADHMFVLGGPAADAAKSLQSCLTLCDPIDGSPPGCPIPGILQARTLEWVAISSSRYDQIWSDMVNYKFVSPMKVVVKYTTPSKWIHL